jgi:sigma-B regulation protein RsbU (phosphoserine phosphatase)
MRQIAQQPVAIEIQERTAAAKVQTSVLPNRMDVPGLEIAAKMLPAEHVGGDYYDVLPVDGGAWIAIGDVAGHGTKASLTMLQIQSAFSALVKHTPQGTPVELWNSLNRTYFENVRTRVGSDDYMTMSILRYRRDGRFELVGAHEELIVWRAETATCELLPINGTWLGVAERGTGDPATFTLGKRDILVLYTDGITEAKLAGGKARVGLDALQSTVAKLADQPAEKIRDAIVALAGTERTDDVSAIAIRYLG